jgi:hypothetical protein
MAVHGNVDGKFNQLVRTTHLDYHQAMRGRRWPQILELLLIFLLLSIVIAPEWPAFGDQAYQLDAIVGLNQFDFLVWELGAIGSKAEAIFANGHSYLDQQTRREVVLSYLELVRDVSHLERQIDNIFADPAVDDPDAATERPQADLDAKRGALLQMQAMAEAIVQDQVGDILVDEGFEVLNQAWPPVMMHMTPLPTILIVSPRDRIERIYGIPLSHGLTTPAKEDLESAVYDDLDLSALVVSLGGLGTYPSMILETSSIIRLAEVTAHEWAHHWLAPFPISLSYFSDARVRTMNETVASIVGTEIGGAMIDRYYPEFAPLPPPPASSDPETPSGSNEPPPFDFQAEMASTRVNVDRLLAESKIDEAEAYMEERREFFAENGFAIRKLNQAYFAFHGVYADQPGESGDDPVGPMLLEIRSQSPTLRAFLESVTSINSFEELEELHRSVVQGG